ncbi:MAG: hypothetical protein R2864_03570 [Syntrophotaleaceae bacterium]
MWSQASVELVFMLSLPFGNSSVACEGLQVGTRFFTSGLVHLIPVVVDTFSGASIRSSDYLKPFWRSEQLRPSDRRCRPQALESNPAFPVSLRLLKFCLTVSPFFFRRICALVSAIKVVTDQHEYRMASFYMLHLLSPDYVFEKI